MARAAQTGNLRISVANTQKPADWSIAVAATLVILGISAIAVPAIADVPVTILIGRLLTLGGLAQMSMMFSGIGIARVVWNMILGIIYFIVGIYFLIHPSIGQGMLAVLLSAILLAEGVLEFIAYFRTRDESGSVWLLTNGLITLLLGGLISIRWPSNSGWAIGILVGANLFMAGFSRLMLGIAERKSAVSLTG